MGILRQITLALALSVGVAICGVALRPLWAEESLSDAFRQEYLPHALALQDAIADTQVSNRWISPNGIVRRYTYFVDDGNERLDTEILDVHDSDTGKPESVALGVSGYSVLLNGTGEKFSIAELDRADSEFPLRRKAHVRCPGAFASFCLLDESLIDILADPSFEVQSSEDVVHEGMPARRIDWEREIPPEGQDAGYRQLGWCVFDLEHGWRLLEFGLAYREQPTSFLFQTMTYETGDGTGSLVSIQRGSQNAESGVRTARHTIDEVSWGARPDPGDFMLQSFGLPALESLVNESQSSQWRLWLIAAAVLPWIAWMIMRSRSRNSPSK